MDAVGETKSEAWGFMFAEPWNMRPKFHSALTKAPESRQRMLEAEITEGAPQTESNGPGLFADDLNTRAQRGKRSESPSR